MDDHLLARYLTGECSAADRREVERWAAQDPSRRAQLEELQSLWAAAEKPARRWEVDAAWKRASARMPTAESATSKQQQRQRSRSAHRRTRRRKARLQQLVSALTIAVAIGVSLWLYAPTPDEQGSAERLQSINTQPAEQARLRLSDGTLIHLNVDSQIEYPKGFLADTRTVRLEGEAYFEVTPDADRPFEVITAGAVTRVLGTMFTVEARSDTASARVAVREGRIAIGSRTDSVRLELGAGELGAVSPSGNLSRRRPQAIDHHFRWIDGQLAFRAAPLREVATRLGRWYGADIRIADPSIAGRRLTATFEHESLDEALSAIALSLHVRPERDGSTVVFYDKVSND